MSVVCFGFWISVIKECVLGYILQEYVSIKTILFVLSFLQRIEDLNHVESRMESRATDVKHFAGFLQFFIDSQNGEAESASPIPISFSLHAATPKQ